MEHRADERGTSEMASATNDDDNVTRHRCPDRRPADEDPRVLRVRRRRQDDDRCSTGATRGRARPAGRRPHHRPGPAPRAVDGPDRARQRAPAGGRRRCGQRRRAARDDARHEADVRRDRARARLGGQGRADPRQPLLPVAVVVVLRHAGVHGDGEARPAARDRRVGPHRRRHATIAVGARLPRRAKAARDISSTGASSAS